ncbi:MAG TPA: electron transfer flavoprotein subunit beta/FixA family protein [Candidatus Ozemobacteraceae bacterium]|nr:electron transfer flavoprotein subunit beta/FixA family protein [Candidatus Ozemobacteraceae bacterium]
MEIVVCVKQVPDTTEVRIDPVKNTLIREGVPSIVNPFDKIAVEVAIQLKEKHGGRVRVVTMGPDMAKDALKECLAIGADEAVLISDRAFAGADTLATSYALAAAIGKMGPVDLILCGKQAIDGDTAQVGPGIAVRLGIPQITYAAKIELNGKMLKVDRESETGFEIHETSMPVMITVGKSIAQPRYPTIKGTMKANRAQIPVWTAADIGADARKIGLNGSPTQVRRIFVPQARAKGRIIRSETAAESVARLMQKLSEAKIV